MDLSQLSRQDQRLGGLLQQAQYWNTLDGEVKRLLPANMRAHCHVVCIEQGELILHTDSAMATSRLKMLLPALLPAIQALDERIVRTHVHTVPRSIAPKSPKPHHIPADALPYFEYAAQRVANRPTLAQALRKLVAHRHKSQG